MNAALTDDLLAGRFFSIDVRGHVTGWNPRATAAFGWETGEISGASFFELLAVPGPGFSPDDLEAMLAPSGMGAGRRVRALVAHKNGPQLPVELSIVPIKLSKAYELNAFLQDVSTSTASGVSSEIGRIREEHAAVLEMLADLLVQEPAAGGEEVRLAGALVVFHIDASASTVDPVPTGGSAGAPAIAAVPSLDDEPGVAREDAERVREEIEAAHASAASAHEEAEAARSEAHAARDELAALRDRLSDAETGAGDASAQVEAARQEASASRAAADEAIREAERLKGELSGLRAAADGTAASAEHSATELGEARAELAQVRSERDRLTSEVEAARAQVAEVEAGAREAQHAIGELRSDLDVARAEAQSAQGELENARAEADLARAEVDAARGEAGAARAELDSISAQVISLREAGEGSDAALEAARAEAASAREELDTLRAELVAARDGSSAELDAIRAEATRAREDADTARGELESLRTELITAREAGDAAATELEAIRAEAASAREDSESAAAELESLRAELIAAREAGEGSSAELGAVRAELEAARAQADAAGQDIGSAQQELGEARAEAIQARSEADQAGAAATVAREQAEQSENDAQAAREEAAQNRAAAEAASRDAEALRAELEAARAQASAAGQDVGSAQSELGEARAEAIQARADADAARAEAAAARAEADQARADAESTRIEADAARAELEAVAATGEEISDHDPVTGLFNRRAFEEELSRHVTDAAKHGDGGAALMVGMDGGWDSLRELDPVQGEQLLKTVAATLKQNVSGAEMLAHLGGDEFAVLLPHADAAKAKRIAQQVIEAVGPQVVKVGDTSVRITVDVGVALFDEREGGEPEFVEAERVESGTHQIIEASALPAVREESPTGTAIADVDAVIPRIRAALSGAGFPIFAQPIIDLRTSEITQYELLLRMRDDQGRIMLPDKFLPAAQAAGLMPQIDQWVVRQAIGLIQKASISGRRLLLEVNVSSDSIDDPALRVLIEQELDATGIDPHLLVIEITEDAALAKIDETIKLAKWVRSMGCRFALDDFGSTFATVKYLKDMPVDYFKLDGDLIVTLPESRTNQLLLNALMDVARGTGTQTIAVYVPDDETLVMLRQYGIGYGQGNRVGRPRPVDEI